MFEKQESPETAKLLVVGRTRIGKGTLISTAHGILKGYEIPAITSHALESHTKETKGFLLQLDGREIEVFDTVGVDDSSRSNIAEDTLLRLLQETGKAAFYPPLVIIATLSGTEKDFLQKVKSVFPEIVVGVRTTSLPRFTSTKADFEATSSIRPLEIFPIKTFFDPEEDEGKSHNLYKEGVQKILDYYKTLIPSRETLDFSSQLFAGKCEKVHVGTEYKEADESIDSLETKQEQAVLKTSKTVTLDNGGHIEERNRTVQVSGNILSLWIPQTINVVDKEFVKDTRDELVYYDAINEVNVNYTVSTRVRKTYERPVFDVYKILSGSIRIFQNREHGDWTLIKTEEIEKAYRKA